MVEAPDIAGLMRDIAADRERHLPIAGTLNFRDAGGDPVQGGGRGAWRPLFRSDALHPVAQAGSAMIPRLHLQTLLDLPTLAERLIAPRPPVDFAAPGNR